MSHYYYKWVLTTRITGKNIFFSFFCWCCLKSNTWQKNRHLSVFSFFFAQKLPISSKSNHLFVSWLLEMKIHNEV